MKWNVEIRRMAEPPPSAIALVEKNGFLYWRVPGGLISVKDVKRWRPMLDVFQG